jgi:diaminopimelate epimerase
VVDFVKGHGTENDFIILPDPDGALDLGPLTVARLCDRRAGIGADGVLRVVRAKRIEHACDPAAEWFMDYRNSDGGVAEMCGNGLRVFARYLVDAGLAAPGDLAVATRAGTRAVRVGADGDVRIDMGPPRILGPGRAHAAGRNRDGLRVSMGNPHLACPVAEPVADLDLSREPGLDPSAFPDGANVELFRPRGDRRIEMRVYERGSGETRSCGTGAVAAAVAAAHAAGRITGTWNVQVPGGTLSVLLDGDTSFLSGPAVLVAEGDLSPTWLARAR